MGLCSMSRSGSRSMSPPAVSQSSPGATVLVVDDDVMVLQAVVILLEDHGFNVLAAVDGVQGMHEYRTHRPDVILTDIIMPQKEGISLIRTCGASSPRRRSSPCPAVDGWAIQITSRSPRRSVPMPA